MLYKNIIILLILSIPLFLKAEIIKMNKKTKQKFYQIPFEKLLNMIEEKSPMHSHN